MLRGFCWLLGFDQNNMATISQISALQELLKPPNDETSKDENVSKTR